MQISNITSISNIESLTVRPEIPTIPEENFTIAVIPDTQRLAENNGTAFNSLVQEIVDEESNKNIKMVLHVGDIVQLGSSTSQWSTAYTALNRLRTNDIPHLLVQGNHDYDDGENSRTSTKFNATFPYSNFTSTDWYFGNYPSTSNENSYSLLKVGSEVWMFFAFEWITREGTRDWADDIISSINPDRIVINTHENLDADATRYDDDYVTFKGDEENSWNPTEMWNWFDNHPEICLIVCGHSVFTSGNVATGGTIGKNAWAKRADTVSEKTINQVMANYQDMDGSSYADSAYIRWMEVDPAEKEISVTTENPVQSDSFTDAGNQFTINYI